MSLDLCLACPPTRWIEEHDRHMASQPEYDDTYQLQAIKAGQLIIPSHGLAPRWASIPARAHFHLTDAAQDAVLDAMASLAMLIPVLINRERVDQMDEAQRGRFRAAESEAPGIPDHKMDDHAEWLITKSELEAAMATLAAHPDPDRVVVHLLGPETLPLWRRWLTYLGQGVRYGGLRTSGFLVDSDESEGRSLEPPAGPTPWSALVEPPPDDAPGEEAP